jgi:hypothetical protein
MYMFQNLRDGERQEREIEEENSGYTSSFKHKNNLSAGKLGEGGRGSVTPHSPTYSAAVLKF